MLSLESHQPHSVFLDSWWKLVRWAHTQRWYQRLIVCFHTNGLSADVFPLSLTFTFSVSTSIPLEVMFLLVFTMDESAVHVALHNFQTQQDSVHVFLEILWTRADSEGQHIETEPSPRSDESRQGSRFPGQFDLPESWVHIQFCEDYGACQAPQGRVYSWERGFSGLTNSLSLLKSTHTLLLPVLFGVTTIGTYQSVGWSTW